MHCLIDSQIGLRMEKFLIVQGEPRGRSRKMYRIVIDESLVKSNVLYIYPNISVAKVDPPEKKKMKWFTYSNKKEFYPVVIRRWKGYNCILQNILNN